MMCKVPSAKPVAAFDQNPETRARVCEKFGMEHNCQSLEELLALEDVDVVYVASPNVFHKEQVIAAANAGKHVFCQKPMA